MTRSAVSVKEVTKSFGEESALNQVSLDVRHGEFCIIVGPSGSGKSTLLKSIAGISDPDHGRIELRGVDVANTPVHERSIGFVFQEFEETLFPHKTVEENIRFGLEQQDTAYSAAEIESKIDEMLEMLAISETKSNQPTELSGGQQQRVELARQLIRECDIMLLDDPLADLDYKLQKRMELEIHRLQRELESTFIYVTHNQDQALKLADKLIVLNEGRVEQIGSPEEIYSNPDSAFVGRFIGDSNMFTGEIVDETATSVTLETEIGPVTAKRTETPQGEGQKNIILVRPQDITIDPQPEEYSNHVTGDLISQTYSGEYTEYQIALDKRDRPLLVTEYGPPIDIQQGTSVAVGWRSVDGMYFDRISVNQDVEISDMEVV